MAAIRAWVLLASLTTCCFASDNAKNTKLQVRLDQTLTSETAYTGESFTTTLDKGMTLDGTVLPKGAKLIGRVAYVHSTSNYSQAGELGLQLVSVASGGQTRGLSTNTVMFEGTDPAEKPHTGGSVDQGEQRADAAVAAMGAAGAGNRNAAQTIPGTTVAVSNGNARKGAQVVLPMRTKLTFLVTTVN
jgi:hypothetical protein